RKRCGARKIVLGAAEVPVAIRGGDFSVEIRFTLSSSEENRLRSDSKNPFAPPQPIYQFELGVRPTPPTQARTGFRSLPHCGHIFDEEQSVLVISVLRFFKSKKICVRHRATKKVGDRPDPSGVRNLRALSLVRIRGRGEMRPFQINGKRSFD